MFLPFIIISFDISGYLDNSNPKQNYLLYCGVSPSGDTLDEHGLDDDEIKKMLKQACQKDLHFSDGKILGSMCSKPLNIAEIAHTMFIEANLGNPGLYPGTKALEEEVIRSVSQLMHSSNQIGQMVAGGTEANITSLWIAKNLAKGKEKNEVIFPMSSHHSINKAVEILGLKAVEIGLDGNYRMDISEVEKKLTQKTVAVVGIAGTTELGVIDPIKELSDLCSDTFFHVDAAFGGFVIPFLKDLGYDVPEFDFRIENVDSISVDAHKMGHATIPSGILLLRKKEYLSNIAIDSPYLTIERQMSLSGTRCSAGVASAFAAIKSLGKEGYRRIVKECMETTNYLNKRLEEISLRPVIKPIMNILAIKLKDPRKVQMELDKEGWKTSLGRYPPCLRVVVMPYITKGVVDEFIPILERIYKTTGEI